MRRLRRGSQGRPQPPRCWACAGAHHNASNTDPSLTHWPHCVPGSGCACNAGHHQARKGGARQAAGGPPRPMGCTGACAGSLNQPTAAPKAGSKRRWRRWRCRPQERGGRASAGRSAGPPSCARPAATLSGCSNRHPNPCQRTYTPRAAPPAWPLQSACRPSRLVEAPSPLPRCATC